MGKLLEELQDGDILIATEISRLGRSLLEVMGILQTCLEKNCQVWTIKESYNLKNDLQSQLLAVVFSIGVSIERSLLSQRTKTALDAKKAAGVKLGRPFGAESKKLKLSKNTKRIRDLLDKKVQTKQDLEGKNWKEVLNIKFNEVVKVKRVNDVLSPQNEAENENNFKKINEEVKNGNLQQALDGLHQLDSSFIVNDPAMQKWMAEVQARINFNQAIANISAHSLALMKVNSIKSN